MSFPSDGDHWRGPISDRSAMTFLFLLHFSIEISGDVNGRKNIGRFSEPRNNRFNLQTRKLPVFDTNATNMHSRDLSR